jgi:hypothetical protein
MEGRHEELEPLDRAYDLSSLGGEVEAVARGDRSMQQCRPGPGAERERLRGAVDPRCPRGVPGLAAGRCRGHLQQVLRVHV